MKKFFVAALAAALIFAMSVTAFAAESIRVNALDVTVASGNATVSMLSSASIKEFNTQLMDHGGYILNKIGAEHFNYVNFYGYVDVKGTASAAKPLTVTFNVPGVKPTDIVHILHFNKNAFWETNGTFLEIIPGIAGDGTITGTFTSLSPITFAVQPANRITDPNLPITTEPGPPVVDPEQPVVDPEQPTVTDPSQQPSATDPTANDAAPEAPADANTSPKTADNGIALFVIAGLAAAAGIVAVSRRKVEE